MLQMGLSKKFLMCCGATHYLPRGILGVVLLVSGCVTVQNSKTITIHPTDVPITVTSTARAQCWDIPPLLPIMIYCQLNMEMESSNGQKVSDFPVNRTSPRYSVSIDNNQALKKYEGSRVKITSISSLVSYDEGCRGGQPIQASDGMTIPQFIEKAFNDELKAANVYSDTGVLLTGSLTKIEFSSSEGLTHGWWDMALRLTSSNGKSMSTNSHYEFKSAFNGITACNRTAQALGPAVQDLIKKAVTDPQFKVLLH